VEGCLVVLSGVCVYSDVNLYCSLADYWYFICVRISIVIIWFMHIFFICQQRDSGVCVVSWLPLTLHTLFCSLAVCPVWAREHCRISPPRFLAECRKRQLNQDSFVWLCFVLFAFSGLCLVCVLSIFLICLLSCIFQHEPTWMAP